MIARAAWCKVRQTPSDDLHRILLMLRRQLLEEGQLSDGQEAFFDQCVAELMWRSARSRRGFRRCWCEFCLVDPDELTGEELPY